MTAKDGSIKFNNLQINSVEHLVQLVSALFENSFESVILTTTTPGDYKILFANPAFCKMTGYDKSELIGQSPKILQGDKTNIKVIQHLRVCLESHTPFHGAAINYKKNGDKYHVEWKINGVFDASGELVAYFSVQRDLTYLKRFLSRMKQTSDNFRDLVKQVRRTSNADQFDESVKQSFQKATEQEIDNMSLFSASLRNDDSADTFDDELFLCEDNFDGVMPIENQQSVINAEEYAAKAEIDVDDITNLSSVIAECLEDIGMLRSLSDQPTALDNLVDDFQEFANLLFFMDEFVDMSTILGSLSRNLKSMDNTNMPGFVIDTMEALILELNEWVSAVFVNRTSENIHEYDNSIIGSAKQLMMMIK